MKKNPSVLGQDPQYGAFLQAAVGDDSSGARVTVLSMLARLGLDPWEEASQLAAAPERTARARLDKLVAQFADVPTPTSARAEIVSQLLTTLPRHPQAPPAFRAIRVEPNETGQPNEPAAGTHSYWWVVAIMLLVVFLITLVMT